MYRIMQRINVVSRCQKAFLEERLKEMGLGGRHHTYLLHVAKKPGISQEELAREVCVNKSSVARGLANLEAMGYVERRNSEQDNRVLQLYPTQKTMDSLPQIRAALTEWNGYLTADFTDEEMSQFEQVLNRVVERAKCYMEEGESVFR